MSSIWRRTVSEQLYAVCGDVDATIIIPGQKVPSPEVQEANQELRAKNIPSILVTARSHEMLQPFLDPANGVDLLGLGSNYCVLNGGATVARADTGQVEWSELLPRETALEVVYGIGELCSNIHYDKASKKLKPVELLEAIERGEMLTSEIPSWFAIFPKEHTSLITGILGSMATIRQPRIMSYDKDPDQLCLQVGSNKNVGNLQALRLAGLEGLPVLKVGDGTNDIDLFNSAPGPNVVMGNATDPELRAMADWIAPPVEEHGYAAALQHFAAFLCGDRIVRLA